MRVSPARIYEIAGARLQPGLSERVELTADGGGIDRSAERGLLLLGRIHAPAIRAAGVLVCGLLAVPSAPRTGLTALVVVAAVLGCGVYWLSLADDRSHWAFLDHAIIIAVCLTQTWTVSPAMLDGGVGWVATFASLAAIGYQWHTRPAVGLALATAVALAFLAGAAQAPADTWAAAWPKGPWIIIQALLSRGLLILLQRTARQVDGLRHREEMARRDAAMVEAARAEEREYLAALHDTAAATLLMVSLGVTGEARTELSRQAERDVATLTRPNRADQASADLIDMIGGTIRHSPLEVTWAGGPPLRLPVEHARVICRAVHAALTNVARHAGVEVATVRAWRQDGEVVVEVADRGSGFDTREVSPHRRGISMSIMEAMKAVGGTAEVLSRPGHGTRVRLVWSPRAVRGAVAEEERRDRFTAVTVVGFMRGLRLSIFAIIMALLLTLEPAMLAANAEVYRSFTVQMAAYLIMLLVAVVGGVQVVRGRSFGRWAWLLMAVVFLAGVAASIGVPAEDMGTAVDWEYGNTGWFGLLLLLNSRLRTLLALVTVDYLMTFVLLVAAGKADPGQLAVLTSGSVLGWVCQVVAIGSTWALRQVSESAMRTAVGEERLRTQEAVLVRIHQDRQARYAALTTTVVPLLEKLASGALDPAEARVRRACAVEAARIRRLIAESDESPDPLIHELRACIDDAERMGITVSLALRGHRPALDRGVRRALTEPALRVLMTAASTARVTVVATAASTTVSVVVDTASEMEDLAGEHHGPVTVTQLTDGRRLWVEATWRPQNGSP